jgi:hypothetical protein
VIRRQTTIGQTGILKRNKFGVNQSQSGFQNDNSPKEPLLMQNNLSLLSKLGSM